ncbi:NACHT domain-containing protein, partial [Peribacillus simplex]|uniref:NACHT domain-containing protein n=3 Tax=Peribacillus TaxID=2675229 RepID=UPI0019D6023C
QHNKNLTDYIYENLITEYAATHVTKRDIERILSRNKNIVLFDGLDEIFHINDKLEIKRDIENFLITHGNSKGIVTSRSIGYEEAKLNDNFLEVGILEFNDDQIEEYVRNWYSENEVNEKILDEEVDAFLELIKDIDDELSRNPLSLSLIVILYRNNGKLPHSKLEIYRGCTNTLVEEWDDLKELNIELSVKNKKVRVFTKLAYWQYLQLSGKQKKNKTPITNSTVLKEVQKIILSFKNLSEDEDEAQAFAKEFLNYAQKRSIYFDNNFTHKT